MEDTEVKNVDVEQKRKRKRKKRRSKSKSGYFGVIKTPSGKYVAVIRINATLKQIGLYDTAEQAANAYDKEAIELRRPSSKLNYPKKAPVGYTPIQKSLQSNNTVGYRGVYKRGKKSKFAASMQDTYLGTYDTAKDAA